MTAGVLISVMNGPAMEGSTVLSVLMLVTTH